MLSGAGGGLELRVRAEALLNAYRAALREADSTDVATRAAITRAVFDSSKAAAAKLETRAEGVDDVAKKFQSFTSSVQPEDIVGKTYSVVTAAAAAMGITSGVILGIVVDVLRAFAEAGQQVGANLPAILTRAVAYPPLLYGLGRWFQSAYESWERDRREAQTVPNQSILARTVDPAERELYKVLGGSPPMRTLKQAQYAGAVALGVILCVVFAGIVVGLSSAIPVTTE